MPSTARDLKCICSLTFKDINPVQMHLVDVNYMRVECAAPIFHILRTFCGIKSPVILVHSVSHCGARECKNLVLNIKYLCKHCVECITVVQEIASAFYLAHTKPHHAG